jgi:hypothetical protein
MQPIFMTSLDLYCERCDPGFWAEPVNALTNISFLIAALFARKLAIRQRFLSLEISTAIALAVTVGIGSFLFHTFADTLTVWLDIIPIMLLQCWFVWLYGRRVMQVSAASAIGLLVILVGGGVAGTQVPHILNGSLGYLPALLILAGLGFWHVCHRRAEPGILLGAAACLFVALIFRTIDMLVCPALPVGTHFLWHLFNGGTVYLALRCLILNLPRGPLISEGDSS